MPIPGTGVGQVAVTVQNVCLLRFHAAVNFSDAHYRAPPMARDMRGSRCWHYLNLSITRSFFGPVTSLPPTFVFQIEGLVCGAPGVELAPDVEALSMKLVVNAIEAVAHVGRDVRARPHLDGLPRNRSHPGGFS